jgi:hypothetical protein
MPNHHAAVAHITIANSEAHSAISEVRGSPPKSTILYIVEATLAFTIVINRTPRKLKMAAITIALRTPIDRVDTQVAMAFGASVQPFTSTTPRVNITVIRSGIFEVS